MLVKCLKMGLNIFPARLTSADSLVVVWKAFQQGDAPRKKHEETGIFFVSAGWSHNVTPFPCKRQGGNLTVYPLRQEHLCFRLFLKCRRPK